MFVEHVFYAPGDDAGGPTTGPDGIERIWTIEFYENDAGEKPVLDWITKDLSPTKRRALGTAMRRVLQEQGPEVRKSNWGDYIAEGIFEFRLRMSGKNVINLEAEIHGITFEEAREKFELDPSEALLLRVFCHAYGEKIVLLLHGYDKGEDPSTKRQQTEIAEAKTRLRKFKARQAAAEKAAAKVASTAKGKKRS